MHRLGIKGASNFVNVDLLASEVQRCWPASRIDPSETQSAFVKFASFLNGTNRQHDVVYPVDHQAIPAEGAAAPDVMDVHDEAYGAPPSPLPPIAGGAIARQKAASGADEVGRSAVRG